MFAGEALDIEWKAVTESGLASELEVAMKCEVVM